MQQREAEIVRRKIGQAIRAYRTAQEISQEQLAEQANMTRNYVGMIERGEKNISVVMLYRFSKALKVPLADIIRNARL